MRLTPDEATRLSGESRVWQTPVLVRGLQPTGGVGTPWAFQCPGLLVVGSQALDDEIGSVLRVPRVVDPVPDDPTEVSVFVDCCPVM